MTFYQTQIAVKDNKYYLLNQNSYLSNSLISSFGNQPYLYIDEEYILIYSSYKGVIHVFKILSHEIIEFTLTAISNIQVPILFRLRNIVYMFYGKVKCSDNIANTMYTINLSAKSPQLKSFKNKQQFSSRLGSAVCQFDETSVYLISGYQEIEQGTTLPDIWNFDGYDFRPVYYMGTEVRVVFAQAFAIGNKIIVVGGLNHILKRNKLCYVIDFGAVVKAKSYEIKNLNQQQIDVAFFHIEHGVLMCQFGEVFQLSELFN